MDLRSQNRTQGLRVPAHTGFGPARNARVHALAVLEGTDGGP